MVTSTRRRSTSGTTTSPGGKGSADRIYEVRHAWAPAVTLHTLFTLRRARTSRCARARLGAGVLVAVPSDPATAVAGGLVVRARRRAGSRTHPADDRRTERCPGVPRPRRRGRRAARRGRVSRRQLLPATPQLPWSVAVQLPGLLAWLGPDDRIGDGPNATASRRRSPSTKTSRGCSGCTSPTGTGGSSRSRSPTDQQRLDRLVGTFARLGLRCAARPVSSRAAPVWSVTSSDGSAWAARRGPSGSPIAFGWSDPILRSLLDGLVDGDRSAAGGRSSAWTTSEGLVADVLLIFARLGQGAGAAARRRRTRRSVTPTRPIPTTSSAPSTAD